MSCSRPFLVSLRVGVEDVPASQSAGDLSAPRIVAITAVCLVAAPFTLEACAEDVCRESSAGGSCRGIERGALRRVRELEEVWSVAWAAVPRPAA